MRNLSKKTSSQKQRAIKVEEGITTQVFSKLGGFFMGKE